MRIAHVCLSCFYIDGYAYQENELVRQHVENGHDVIVIASTETFGPDRRLAYVEPATYKGKEGARVIRLPYRRFLPHSLMRKLRLHPGVYKLLQHIQPEVILFHGLCGWELFAVSRYKQGHPGVRLFVDSHEDWHNSARGFVSRYILHRLYYRWIISRCSGVFDKVLCVSLETMDFVQKTYGIPVERLEFYPLGGRVFSDAEYLSRREQGRRDAGVDPDQVLMLQTGKMDLRKKVLESLMAFTRTHGSHLRFVLAGSLNDTIRVEAEQIIASDSRIRFLGWKSADELSDLLCAADVYVQPGTQSATMQMSLCARCPVILDEVPSHVPYVKGNGWLMSGAGELDRVFLELAENPDVLKTMAMRSLEIAQQLLDYKTLAARIT